MTHLVTIDAEPLFLEHDLLLEIEGHLDDIVRESASAEKPLAQQLQALARRLIDQLENVLDSEASREAAEDVRLHGAVPWGVVEADLGNTE